MIYYYAISVSGEILRFGNCMADDVECLTPPGGSVVVFDDPQAYTDVSHTYDASTHQFIERV